MTVQTVEKIEMFSEAELETLQFMPEELELIQSEQIPDLESISLEEVARYLEVYFVEDFEDVEDLEDIELERFGFLKRLFKRGRRGGKKRGKKRGRKSGRGKRYAKRGFKGLGYGADALMIYQMLSGG